MKVQDHWNILKVNKQVKKRAIRGNGYGSKENLKNGHKNMSHKIGDESHTVPPLQLLERKQKSKAKQNKT